MLGKLPSDSYISVVLLLFQMFDWLTEARFAPVHESVEHLDDIRLELPFYWKQWSVVNERICLYEVRVLGNRAHAYQDLIMTLWTDFSFEFWHDLRGDERYFMFHYICINFELLYFAICSHQEEKALVKYCSKSLEFRRAHKKISACNEDLARELLKLRAAYNKVQFGDLWYGNLYEGDFWFQGPECRTPESLTLLRAHFKRVYEVLGYLGRLLHDQMVLVSPWCHEILEVKIS